MKARAFTGTLLLIVLALCANLADSQTPQGFTYQAVIRNSDGTPLADKTIGMRITLQNDSQTALYTETHSSVTNGQGVISIIIGGGTPVGQNNLTNVSWQNGEIFIKVEVDPNGGTAYVQMGNPVKLLSVPFALYAASGTQGPAGNDGISISWLGALEATPSSPLLNQAYYNTIEKKSFIWNGSSWNLLAQDGVQGIQGLQGSPGTGLSNKGAWSSGVSYSNGDYVFDRSTANASMNSMWICQLAVISSTQPYLDNTHWVEFQAPAGPQGQAGTNGSPGANGISISWLGDLSAAPANPSINQAYYNITDKKSYVYGNSGWSVISQDGTQGSIGMNGSNGSNGVSILWLGTSATAPLSPALNNAYYNTTTKKSYVYDGTSWQIITQDGMPINGTLGQTLYFNGSDWTPSSVLLNNGTNLGVGVSPTTSLDVNGGIRIRGSLYDNTTANLNAGTSNQLLTSTGSGVLWQSPSNIGVANGTGNAGQVALWSGSNNLQGLSNVTWASSLQVASNTDTQEDPIFEVKNKNGQVVFGVYQNGVRVYVENAPIAKGSKGGFAVGGLSNLSKTDPVEYFRIYPDSARIYVKENLTKGSKGGFAVGGLSNLSKGSTRDLMFIGTDSARIYINGASTTPKGAKGGFAVGGLSNLSKGKMYDLLRITTDSTRFYINDSISSKGAKGGFAVGGLSNLSKGGKANFFNIETGNTSIINPSEPRILWYPKKNAFLTGQVLIEHPDSVGTNSFSSGFESKAKGEYSIVAGYQSKAIGNWSQAFGYKTIAQGANSTALGDQSVSSGESSFAIGFHSTASGMQSTAFGGNCIASGANSIASGYYTTASGIGSFANGLYTVASGNNSLALGWQNNSSGAASTTIGVGCSASNDYSFALGYVSQASGINSFAFGNFSYATQNYSYSFGKYAHANGVSSYAFGENVVAGNASNGNCYAFGKSTQATGSGSYAFGDGALASGTYATAFGKNSTATNTSSFAFGESAVAESPNSFALGLGAHAYGQSCYAFGESAQASNLNSVAFGKGATASGQNSFAFGAWGQDDFTYPSGTNTTASGDNSFAAGQGAVASDIGSISIGFCTKASGQKSIAMGFGSQAGPNHSGVALGEYAFSSGYGSVSLGWWTNATNSGSVALGWATKSVTNYCTSIGSFNLGLANSLFEIGNGYAEAGRSNVFTVLNTGNVGVGTSTPDAKLELLVDAMGGNSGIGIKSSQTGGKLLTINQGTAGKLMITEPGVYDLATFDFTTQMVGIGVTNPQSPLHVESSNTGHLVNFRNLLNTNAGKGVAIATGVIGSPAGAEFITFFTPQYVSVGSITGTSGGVQYNTSSDIRLKENIVSSHFSIADLMKIKVHDFNFISDNAKTKVTGFIAQELFEIYPDAVYKPIDDNAFWAVDYGKVSPLIVKAVQDQQVIIETMKGENLQLKNQIEDLKLRLEKIEELLSNKEVKK